MVVMLACMYISLLQGRVDVKQRVTNHSSALRHWVTAASLHSECASGFPVGMLNAETALKYAGA